MPRCVLLLHSPPPSLASAFAGRDAIISEIKIDLRFVFAASAGVFYFLSWPRCLLPRSAGEFIHQGSQISAAIDTNMKD